MRSIRRLAFCLCLALPLGSWAGLSAQLAEKANQGYKTKEDRSRVARNLDSPEREERQKPRELLQSLDIKRGDVIADIGTGVGFMLPYLVESVGPEGVVYAQDIQADFLTKVGKKINNHGWQNVRVVRGAERDVKLPAESLDWAFILDVYHHFNYPRETMATVRAALRPSGHLAVVDFYRSRKHPRMTKERLQSHIRLDRDEFAAEIESAGFRLVQKFDHLPHQYVLVFKRE